MIDRILVVLALATVAGGVMAAEAYRWEDAKGNVYYSDSPPPPNARNVRRARVSGNGDAQELPYRLQVAVKKAPVTLYVTDCGEPCDEARALLKERGVPHTMLDAKQAKVQEELKKLTGGDLVVPVVTVGKNVLKGFDDRHWNSALDAAGYPSYAMIDVTPYIREETAPEPGTESEVDTAGLDDSVGEDTEGVPARDETEPDTEEQEDDAATSDAEE